MGQPQVDPVSVKLALLVVAAHADDPVAVLDLAGIDWFDLPFLLLGPLRLAAVVNDLFRGASILADRECAGILVASHDGAGPARRLLGGTLLCFLSFRHRPPHGNSGHREYGQQRKHQSPFHPILPESRAGRREVAPEFARRAPPLSAGDTIDATLPRSKDLVQQPNLPVSRQSEKFLFQQSRK